MPNEEQSEVESSGSAGTSEAAVAEGAALIAAAEKAMASESAGEDAAPVSDKGAEADDKALAAKVLKSEPAAAPSGPTLAQRLRNRENKQRIHDEATRLSRENSLAIDRDRAQMNAQIAELAAEKRSLTEMQARYKAAATDPMKLMEITGRTKEQLAHEMAMAGSPEHVALMELRAKAEALEEKHRSVDEFIAKQTKREEEQTRAARDYEVRQGEQQFVQAATNEKYVALNALYEPREILEKGRAVQTAYYNKTGNVATDEEIAEYLEYEARPRLEKIRQGSAGSAVAPKAKANGPRTLSASGASERRATPKRIEQLTDAEERTRLMEIADEAMRTSPS